jgi:hypothetical protein
MLLAGVFITALDGELFRFDWLEDGFGDCGGGMGGTGAVTL